MTITVVIPAQACGLIIGKGGERINALREQCQAKIQLQSKDRIIQGLDERTVTIVGNLLNAQMVFPLLCSSCAFLPASLSCTFWTHSTSL